ncbi:cell wall-binding protein [Dehalococcoides mccartyi]|uniref:Bacterial repeat domain-containing protein n=1 Tax=Dehalococcoides mccartyi TaxID=61435 RepID=A0A328EMR8_9CHLR|nr:MULTISPECIES: InlB B-repeat-containing protein [Dehalococcoides]AGG07094.1 hypothetical protein dcmb_1507 [Dehalococcoides mccartyi DCMB5]KSV18207.1 cell wall-binding protein [Dehalococcoides mccartyi]RAL69930.1 hypothetical protein C1G87_0078 [Dehalococcoides mccartyi]BAS32575.1 cell wall/surface repeat protein [Dehalococcoides mccartyi IBARAKI]
MAEKELNPEPEDYKESPKENFEPEDEYKEPQLEPETPAEISQSEKIPGYYFYRRKKAKTKLKRKHFKMPGWFNISLTTLLIIAVIFGTWGLAAGHFPPWGFSVDVATTPVGGGTVNLSPDQASYSGGSRVDLNAVPANGYRFGYWGGDASGTDPSVSLSMNSSKSVTATFIRQHHLNISTAPQSGGSLSTISGDFDAGTILSLTTSPMPGYRFDYWSGDVSGTNPSISITMDTDKNIVANFVPLLLLTVNLTPTSAGIVSPATEYFDYGATVTLTAQAAPGYQFVGWTGDLTNISATINITMDKNYTLTANFAPIIQSTSMVLPNRIGDSTWISWSKNLIAGQYIVINSGLTGVFNLSDSSHLWRVEVFSPDGEYIDNWFGDYWLTPEHVFAFQAQISGTYVVKISHYSSFIKDLSMTFSPGGWIINGNSWS